jgi:hypothetical protein
MLAFLAPLFGPIFYGGMCELLSVPGQGFPGEDNWVSTIHLTVWRKARIDRS